MKNHLKNKESAGKCLKIAIFSSKSMTTTNKYYVYNLNLDKPSEYAFTVVDNLASELIIDGRVHPVSSSISLNPGSHKIEIEKAETTIFEAPDIKLDDNEPKYKVSVGNLKPSFLYEISFEYLTESGVSINYSVLDDFGKIKFTAVLGQTGAGWMKHSEVIRTNNAVTSPYTLSIYAEKKGSRTRNIGIRNLKWSEFVLPTVIAEENVNFSSPVYPEIKYEYLSPTSYKVNVANAREPYILSLKDAYSPSWEASINGKVVPAHFRINSAFNGWYVDKKGDYTISLSIPLQRSYYISSVVSLIFLVGLLTAAVAIRYKK